MSRARGPILAGVAVVLAGVIALELITLSDPPPDAPPPAIRPVQAPPPPADDLPLQIAAILARPVFAPDRKPEMLQGGTDPGLPRLTGILVTNGSRQAIFAGSNNARSTVRAEGETIGAYTVQAITPADVTLAGTDGLHRLRPTYSTAAQAGADPMQAPLFQPPPPQVFQLPPQPPSLGAPALGAAALAQPRPGSTP